VSAITTHVLDVSRGEPAVGVAVRLELSGAEGWNELGSGQTDEDGRVSDLLAEERELIPGVYRLTFEVGGYFAARQVESFYPRAAVEFEVTGGSPHYHVPLLLSPFGYSTYRGS